MAAKTTDPKILVSLVEEVPRISDREREELVASLQRARAEIAAGQYDVVTSKSLRAEFEAIAREGKTDDEVDADLSARFHPTK